MKLRYMIDSIISDRQAAIPEYVPVGVWVQGPGPGLDVEMYYLDRGPNGLADRRDEAAWVVNRLVEAGARNPWYGQVWESIKVADNPQELAR